WNRADPQSRRLVQGVRVHDVRLVWSAGNSSPGRAAEPFLVQMQRRHGQASKAPAAPPARHEAARVRRPHQFDIDAVDGMARLAGYQRDTSNDVDVDSQ